MVSLLRGGGNHGASILRFPTNNHLENDHDYGENGGLLGFKRGGQQGGGSFNPIESESQLKNSRDHDPGIEKMRPDVDIFATNENPKQNGDAQSDLKSSKTCRNSVQGKVFLADDLGFVCLRKDLSANGCCDEKATSSKRFSCETCSESFGCCAIYEHCVSCCLEPNKKPLLSKLIQAASNGGFPSNVLYSSLTDHFEFCLARCRTSSQSVQHENSYRDPKAKHCFGESGQTADGGLVINYNGEKDRKP